MANSIVLVVFCFLALSVYINAFAPRHPLLPPMKTSMSRIQSQALSADSISGVVIEKSAWDFVDDVFLITTTQKDNQRLERTKEQLEIVNLWDRVKVRMFKPDDEDRVRGCYTSHIAVLEEIQKRYKSKKNYKVMVLEDNLEVTQRINQKVIESVAGFVDERPKWDVFHLAYMMYVPGFSLSKLNSPASSWNGDIVQMFSANSGSSVGTSAYVISKSGVDAVLASHRRDGYVEAIPNIMAQLFPDSRFAAYPMAFHRAAKVGSLVNPQLDDFRKIMFSPAMYSTWERLMVGTGLQNNQLFPALLISLLLGTLGATYAAVTSALSGENEGAALGPAQLVLAFPLFVALWGASLFKPGNSGAGFAKSAQEVAAAKAAASAQKK